MLTCLVDVELRSPTPEVAVIDKSVPKIQEEMTQRPPLIRQVTDEDEVLPWARRLNTESLDVKPIHADQGNLFYSIRSIEYSLKKEFATEVLQRFADHLDNEYTITKRNCRRMEEGADGIDAESKLRLLDGLSDELARIAGKFGAREE